MTTGKSPAEACQSSSFNPETLSLSHRRLANQSTDSTTTQQLVTVGKYDHKWRWMMRIATKDVLVLWDCSDLKIWNEIHAGAHCRGPARPRAVP